MGLEILNEGFLNKYVKPRTKMNESSNDKYRINYDDDLVIVKKGSKVIYKGLEDYEPMKNEPWKFDGKKYTLDGGYTKKLVKEEYEVDVDNIQYLDVDDSDYTPIKDYFIDNTVSNEQMMERDIKLLNKYPDILTDEHNSLEQLVQGLTDGTIEPFELYDWIKATLDENGIKWSFKEAFYDSLDGFDDFDYIDSTYSDSTTEEKDVTVHFAPFDANYITTNLKKDLTAYNLFAGEIRAYDEDEYGFDVTGKKSDIKNWYENCVYNYNNGNFGWIPWDDVVEQTPELQECKLSKKSRKLNDESLNEADTLAKPLKRDVKNQYKRFDSNRDYVNRYNKNIDKKYKDMTGNDIDDKTRDFLYKKSPDKFKYREDSSKKLERKSFPYYVTYYEEVPYYHPEEGGYYHSGMQAMKSVGFESKQEANEYAKELADELELTQKYNNHYSSDSKYIGDNVHVYVEKEKDYLGQEKGDSVYESLKEDLDKSDYLKFTDEVVQAVIDIVMQHKNVSSQQIKDAVSYCNQFVVDEVDYWFDESLKTKLNSLLKQLHEGKMSPEDAADSKLLASMFNKLQYRKNAKFTPEENAVLAKYGLKRQQHTIVDDNNNNLFQHQHTPANLDLIYVDYNGRMHAKPNEVNYADRARKMSDRKYADHINFIKRSRETNFENAEKIYQNKQMTQNLNDMKKLLSKNDLFYNEDLKIKLNGLLRQLHEKEMSDEDKHDNEILKGIYTKINGKKVGKNTFTPEEQEILKKYGLDSWGYRGQTKMVTDAGRKDVVKDNETKSSWRKPAKFNKINYADRARKIDDRDYAQNINNRKYYNQSFDDAEKEFQNKQLTKNVDNMKSLLKSRKYHQDQIDNSDKNLQKRLDDIEQTYQKDLQAANDDVEWKRSYYGRNILDAQDRIDKLLDKHKVKECLKRLSEAMSPEDEADTELLKNIYYKILNRSNAKLTPEEQAVINKYNLKRVDKNLVDSDYNALFSGKHNSKVNYADKARKLSDRNYAKDIEQNYRYRGKTFQDKEQDKINQDISADVEQMKSALYDRKRAKANFDDAERNYRFKTYNAEVNKQNRIDREKRSKDDQLNYHKNSLDKVNSEIKSMLKKESLNEDAANKVRIKTGLTGEKNSEILNSVIGQMSDGIWENSPGMTGYWYPVNIDGTDIVVDNVMDFKYGDKYVTNKYYHMSEAEVKRFFANKIKQIAQEWLNDNNLNPYKNWNAECDEICTYLDRGSDVTIADAYNAYKALK